MKELFKDSFDSNKVEIVEEKQQKKEIKLIGQQRKVPGLILWEFNEKTKVINRAKFKLTNVFISSLSMSTESITHTHKVIVNENCVYIQALNLKNAIKHLKRLGYTNLKTSI